MPLTSQHSWTGQKLEPYLAEQEVPMIAVAIEPAGTGLTRTIAKGTILGQVTADGKYLPYAVGNSDGSELARVILAYDIVVDDAGRIAMTGTAGNTLMEWGQQQSTIGCYYRGPFRTNDLTGLDQGALDDLRGRLISGSLTDGVMVF